MLGKHELVRRLETPSLKHMLKVFIIAACSIAYCLQHRIVFVWGRDDAGLACKVTVMAVFCGPDNYAWR
eukprot:scaffold418933_cov40-Prasinocladus_malaysianus.AAC.1